MHKSVLIEKIPAKKEIMHKSVLIEKTPAKLVRIISCDDVLIPFWYSKYIGELVYVKNIDSEEEQSLFKGCLVGSDYSEFYFVEMNSVDRNYFFLSGATSAVILKKDCISVRIGK